MTTPATGGASGTVYQFANMDILCKSVIANGQTLVPEAEFLAGTTYYVDSAVDGAGGTTPGTAVGTLDEAFALCTANKGDRIVVMPNHSETVTGAGGIAADVAGVTVIGLGRGGQRPRFLMDAATTVTVTVTAADVTFHNLVFAAGHADIVTCFNITAGYCTLSNIEFVENTTAENFLTEIKATSTTDNNADGLRVIGCRALTVDSAGLEFIEVNADLDGLVVADNLVVKDAATSGKFILCATGKDLTNCEIVRNRHVCGMTTGDIFIDNDTTANSGIVADNRIGHHDTAGAVVVDCDGVRQFENYSASEDTSSGLLLPAADDDT